MEVEVTEMVNDVQNKISSVIDEKKKKINDFPNKNADNLIGGGEKKTKKKKNKLKNSNSTTPTTTAADVDKGKNEIDELSESLDDRLKIRENGLINGQLHDDDHHRHRNGSKHVNSSVENINCANDKLIGTTTVSAKKIQSLPTSSIKNNVKNSKSNKLCNGVHSADQVLTPSNHLLDQSLDITTPSTTIEITKSTDCRIPTLLTESCPNAQTDNTTQLDDDHEEGACSLLLQKDLNLAKALKAADEKPTSASTSIDTSNVVIEYKVYENELQMPDIMRLIQKDLSEPYSIYTYRYFIHNWPKLCFLAMHEKLCVGAIVCKLDIHRQVNKRGYIAMLAVDKNYRKLKIGTNLVAKAIQAMLVYNADEVVLETEITNIPALRLYENLGFVRDKRLFGYYLNGVDALRLKLWFR